MAGSPVTWAQTVRDVLIASINKGQFPLAILGLVVLALIWKTPEEIVGSLVMDLFTRAEYWGYPLAVVGFGGWFVHARKQRQMIAGELDRISGERNKAQQATLGKRVKSSEAKS